MEAGEFYFDLRWLAAPVFCTLSVLTLTHLPQDLTPEALRDGPFHIDKAEHVVAYGLISICSIPAVKRRHGRILLAVLLAVTVLSALDELTQPLIGRTASPWDLLADLIGVALAFMMSLIRRHT